MSSEAQKISRLGGLAYINAGVRLHKFLPHLIFWLLAFYTVQLSQHFCLRGPNSKWSLWQEEKQLMRLMFQGSSSSCRYPYLYHNAAILAELFASYENLMKQFSDILTWIKNLKNTQTHIHPPINFSPFYIISHFGIWEGKDEQRMGLQTLFLVQFWKVKAFWYDFIMKTVKW